MIIYILYLQIVDKKTQDFDFLIKKVIFMEIPGLQRIRKI
jgi:hypothetical protein